MDRRMLTSAVVIHAGACLVAFMAMGSPDAFHDEEPVPTARASKPQPVIPKPLPAMNAFRSEVNDPDSEIYEASDVPDSESGVSSSFTH